MPSGIAASTDPDRISRFSPAFMYPLVGENETIYGYRSLAVRLHFASGSLKNYLGIEYEGDPLAGGKALDIEKTFYEFIPSGALVLAEASFYSY
jgi:histone acetyltransferase 1